MAMVIIGNEFPSSIKLCKFQLGWNDECNLHIYVGLQPHSLDRADSEPEQGGSHGFIYGLIIG